MAKIRLIEDGTWRMFERKRIELGFSPDMYMRSLLEGSTKEYQENYKQQAHDAINESAQKLSKMESKLHRDADIIHQQRGYISSLEVELEEQKSKLAVKIDEYKGRFLEQERELNELQERINEQKAHIETQEDTLRDAGDKIAELTQTIANLENAKELTLEEAEEILKDE